MSAHAMDRAKADAFAEHLVEMMNGSALMLMISIGHRTGLFDTMAAMEPATSQQIADKAGLNERYVREWLGAMTTGGITIYDPTKSTYSLPAEHAASLTRAAEPNNMAGFAQWFALLGGVEDTIVDAFRHGEGVPYSAYGHRFHEVMAEESAQTVVAGLEEHIVPLVPGLRERLESGIEVLDVGCGSGRAMIALAERFPESRFTGYDFSEQGIASARAEAERRGLSNTHFEVQDAAALPDSKRFDLITTFDAVHDQARPDKVLEAIHRALADDGTYLMQDIKASSEVQNNVDHPLGPFIYTISCMHCMSVSLAEGGMGLGAAWGKEKAVEMLGEAGFSNVDVKELAHDFQNYWYVVTK